MISLEHKFIFLHVPKCGGTSIEKAFGHFDPNGRRGQQDHRTLRNLTPGFHPGVLLTPNNLYEYRRRFRQRHRPRPTREQFETFFKFAIVRDPWSRAFSWYRNYQRDPLHRKSGEAAPEFDAFLRAQIGKGVLRSQLHWLRGYDGRVSLDYVGRFEHLQQEFDYVCDRLGIDGLRLPHMIAGGGGDHRRHYDRRLVDLVYKHYRQEIRLFGFSFE